ncbi:hypothetical protein FQR65_LT09758 [Abscondita terminalis]|nr:hypothetical protein FQR65_LT09758 [Abscondita terminalis]
MFSYYILIIALAATCVSAARLDVLVNCIPISECPQLYKLALQDRDSSETIRLLRHSHCGYANNGQPLVWCSEIISSDCKISSGKVGVCMDFNQCGVFNGLIVDEIDLDDIQSYLYHPQCKEINQRYICCPTLNKTSNEIVTPSTPNVLPNPDNRECGLQEVPRVFGGKQTQFEEFPWAAQLQYQSGSDLTRNCGGTLISNKYVVTAAHCVDRAAIRAVGKLVSVVFGEYDTRNESDCLNMLGIRSCADPPLIAPVDSIIIHPNWNNKPPATIDHDIALVRLNNVIKFTQYIRPICLPMASLLLKDGERLTVAGWGQTETEISSPVKLKAVLPIVNKKECALTYKRIKRLTVGEGEFCVGGEAGIDSCTGDSGGPLMYSSQINGESVWYLAGVVSFGPNQPCGVINYPGLYTYVPKYIDWIHSVINT